MIAFTHLLAGLGTFAWPYGYGYDQPRDYANSRLGTRKVVTNKAIQSRRKHRAMRKAMRQMLRRR